MYLLHLFTVVQSMAVEGHAFLLPRPPSQLPLKQLEEKSNKH